MTSSEQKRSSLSTSPRLGQMRADLHVRAWSSLEGLETAEAMSLSSHEPVKPYDRSDFRLLQRVPDLAGWDQD